MAARVWTAVTVTHATVLTDLWEPIAKQVNYMNTESNKANTVSDM